jgi:hypothetical protein
LNDAHGAFEGSLNALPVPALLEPSTRGTFGSTMVEEGSCIDGCGGTADEGALVIQVLDQRVAATITMMRAATQRVLQLFSIAGNRKRLELSS